MMMMMMKLYFGRVEGRILFIEIKQHEMSIAVFIIASKES